MFIFYVSLPLIPFIFCHTFHKLRPWIKENGLFICLYLLLLCNTNPLIFVNILFSRQDLLPCHMMLYIKIIPLLNYKIKEDRVLNFSKYVSAEMIWAHKNLWAFNKKFSNNEGNFKYTISCGLFYLCITPDWGSQNRNLRKICT